MLKMTRAAVLAAVLCLAMTTGIVPSGAHAQTPPPAPPSGAAAPAAPAAPADMTQGAPKTPAGAERATEVVDNPYGLEALW